MGLYALKMKYVLLFLFAVLFLTACKNQSETEQTEPGFIAGSDFFENRLQNRHAEQNIFEKAVGNARNYLPPDGFLYAGAAPHHMVAAEMISGFYKAAAENKNFDTVVIIAPNHSGEAGSVIVSKKDWDVGSGVLCDAEIIGAVLAINIEGVTVTENDFIIEFDHSASVHVPFVNHYMPNTKIAPVLLSRTLSFENTMQFADKLIEILNGKNILLVASIDFSHFLTPAESFERDMATLRAVNGRDLRTIHGFSNAYVDSPASLIVYLRYLDFFGLENHVLDHADASVFMQTDETTSYFIFYAVPKRVD